ncbi:manganese-binding transcriptional regulator MntR [bacterium]|nr:manganese-binding transcriptional regulator MntR [bacterium]
MSNTLVKTANIPLKTRVKGHLCTRRAHARELSEDYVEAIAELTANCGRARVIEIAKALGVTHVTVIRTLKRLTRYGLVIKEPYRGIILTDSGKKLAERSKKKHQIVLNFLLALGIDEHTAIKDSEGIEHHVSPATLDAFARYLEVS